ncbi:MAG: inositol monophosphatase [Bacteroidia bacterium]|nr:inositol monophosphatase [Bacteroidia bacterium]
MSSSLPSVAALDSEIQSVIRTAGDFARQEFEVFNFDTVEYKAENDPFTYVDVRTEELLKEGLSQLIPGAGFTTEEAKSQATKNGWEWIIDPIDGTSNFTHGIPHFSISVGLAYQKKMMAGYVFQPVGEVMYHAQKGQGAWENERPLRISPRADLPYALVATGFPYSDMGWRREWVDLVVNVLDAAHGVRRFGSAALDLANVAAGRLDVFFEFNLKSWDVAAGSLLVQEAGGLVTDFQGGNDYIYGRQIVASNGHLHAPMLALLEHFTALVFPPTGKS